MPMAELPSVKPHLDAMAPLSDMREAGFPLLSIANVTRRGLVLFSRRNLEVGSNLHLGLHVRLKSGDRRSAHSHFIDVHGFVVSSTPHTGRGPTLFEITLLYDRMPVDQRRLLSSVPLSAIKATAYNSLSDHEAMLLLGERTRSVIGLN